MRKTQLGAVKGGPFPETKYPHTILVWDYSLVFGRIVDFVKFKYLKTNSRIKYLITYIMESDVHF